MAGRGAQNGLPLELGDALAGPDAAHWRDAHRREQEQWGKMGVALPATAPSGAAVFKTKHLFSKNLVNGHMTYKVTTIACGPNTTSPSVPAPSTKLRTLRLMLALANEWGFDLVHARFVDPYLNVPVPGPEPIYICNPEGFVMRLQKLVPGLRQSAGAWAQELERGLATLGLSQCSHGPGLFARTHSRGFIDLLVFAYSGDLLIANLYSKAAPELLTRVQALWPSQLLNKLEHQRSGNLPFLGINLQYGENPCSGQGYLALDQHAYIQELLSRFSEYDTLRSFSNVPITSRILGSSLIGVPCGPYRSLVGSLQWLAQGTRPDLSFTVSYLGRFTATPTQQHWHLALFALGYVARTRHLKLRFEPWQDEFGVIDPDDPDGSVERSLEVHAAASWPSGGDSGKCSVGWLVRYMGCPIDWTSRRKDANSELEADYVALDGAATIAVELRELLTELGLEQGDAATKLFFERDAVPSSINQGEPPPGPHTSTRRTTRLHRRLRKDWLEGNIEIDRSDWGLSMACFKGEKFATDRNRMGVRGYDDESEGESSDNSDNGDISDNSNNSGDDGGGGGGSSDSAGFPHVIRAGGLRIQPA